MTDDQKKATREFFEASKKLSELGIIRSSKYLGDISEFLCSHFCGITLNQSGRETGYDGVDLNGIKVEIKYHGGQSGTNIVMSKYEKNQKFQDLIVVLGIDSQIRPNDSLPETYLIYRIPNYKYGLHGNIAKTMLPNFGKLVKILDKEFNDILISYI
jgi:hypothetical protein